MQDNLYKIYENMDTPELEKILYVKKGDYTSETIKTIEDVLSKRTDRTSNYTEKISPASSRMNDNEMKASECAFKSSEKKDTKLKDISLARKHGTANAMYGLIIYVISRFAEYYAIGRYKLIGVFFGFLGIILIVRGIYEVVTGRKMRLFKSIDFFRYSPDDKNSNEH